MQDQSDTTLWDRIKDNDADAFKMLYEQHIDDLLKFGKSLTANRDLVQDAIQSLFTYLWDKRSSINPPTHLKAYLLRSLRNNLLRDVKKARKITDLCSEQQLQGEAGIPFTNDDEYQHHRMQIAIQRLSIREREVIHLKYYQEIRNREISDIMDISYQSVANLLQRALKQIKANLEADENLDPQ